VTASPPEPADLASLSSLDDPVRSRLYQYVSGCAGPVGRDEAAAAAGIGRALAVYHLDKLVETGLLTASYQRPAGRGGPGAGRPAKLYARSGREFTVSVPPREYELAARLLVQAVGADATGQSRAALGQAARQFGARLGTTGHRGARPGPRECLTAALHEHGFAPFDAADGAIRLRNCPFHHLAEQDRQTVCGMNLALVEGLATGLGAAGLRPVLDPQPGHCCVAIQDLTANQQTTAIQETTPIQGTTGEDDRHGA
jgi:predicted ArsR family transcriptional regulator